MNNTIMHTPTQEEYNQVVDKLGWYNGNKNRNTWERYKEETAVVIENNKIQDYSELDWYKKNLDYKDYNFITAKDVLGYQVGDVFESEEGKRELLAILPERFEEIDGKYLLSERDDFDEIGTCWNKKELDNMTLVKDDITKTEKEMIKALRKKGFKITK